MPDHYTRSIARELRAEISASAKDAAPALAFPDDAHDAAKVSQVQMVEHVRRESLADPEYLATLLDRMAPAGPKLPNGTVLRAPNGVAYYRALVKEARPEVYEKATGKPAVKGPRVFDRILAQEETQ